MSRLLFLHAATNLSPTPSPKWGGGAVVVHMPCMWHSQWGGGGGTLIYNYTYVGLGLFFGSKFWISIFLGVLRKMNIFGGYEDFVDIFLGSSQNWASLRVISMRLRVLFKVKVQNWDIFWVAKISIIFLGCLKFLIFFWGWAVDAESEPTYTEKNWVSPLGWHSHVLGSHGGTWSFFIVLHILRPWCLPKTFRVNISTVTVRILFIKRYRPLNNTTGEPNLV